MSAINAYVINLDRREDRFLSAKKQLKHLGLNFKRISAHDAEREPLSSSYVTNYVESCWISHVKALKAFLESDVDLGLILEDDFRITDFSKFSEILEALEKKQLLNIDFLQIGFLTFGSVDAGVLKNAERQSSINLLLGRMSKVSVLDKIFGLRELARVKESQALVGLHDEGIKAVANQIRPGAHCYLVSKDFAHAMMEANTPCFFSTDQLFMSLGDMRIFRMLRLEVSICKQDGTLGSDILSRFRLTQ